MDQFLPRSCGIGLLIRAELRPLKAWDALEVGTDWGQLVETKKTCLPRYNPVDFSSCWLLDLIVAAVLSMP